MFRTKDAPWTEAGRIEFQSRRSAQYKAVYRSTAFLRNPTSKRGAIFVCGSPLDYVLGKREQALSANGYSLDLELPEQWPLFNSEFEVKRPAFVYVEQACQTLLVQHSSATINTLRRAYNLRRRSSDGTWYERAR